MNESVWQAVLDRERNAVEDKAELDMVDEETDEEELEEEAENNWGDREFVSDISGDEDEDFLSAGPRVEVEYENEIESVPISKSALASW